MTSGEGPYFEQEDALDQIDAVASQPSLVVYAGAGVSIDRTNTTWPDLIERLMVGHIIDDRVRSRLLSDSPLQSASIVKQMYMHAADDEAVLNQRIADDVRSCLYAKSGPACELRRSSGIARAVIELVSELKRQGRTVHLVTTNYDDCLQQEVKRLAAKHGTPQLALDPHVPQPPVTLDDMADEVGKAVEENRIVHLHGFVPEVGGGAGAITLSEVDYAKSYQLSSAILERLFREHSVLILGSSLTDPPLVSALANSKEEADQRGLVRVAVMPIQGFRIPRDAPEDLRDAIRHNVESRMEHFSVDVTFPDFYSQVSQFVAEVRICAEEASAGRVYRGSDVQYGRRLASWWTNWEGVRKANWANANRNDHETLAQCVRLMRSKYLPRLQSVEIEIWIRWHPGSKRRQLRLWASSNAAWPEVDARTATIAADSKYISVQTFSNGRIEHHEPEEGESPSRRQRKYLCVPIRLTEGNQKDLPVAVVSLAYSIDNGNHEPYVTKLRKIADELVGVGESIAGS